VNQEPKVPQDRGGKLEHKVNQDHRDLLELQDKPEQLDK
jgi:hypothetical protein